MMKPISGTCPSEFYPAILAAFDAANKDVNKMDAVTGATVSRDAFVNMMTAIIENAKEGDTSPIVVEAAAE